MSDQNVFERVEKKYRLSQKQYDLFLKETAKKLHMDEYGLHTIRNIYYDTANYELIRRSMDKPKYKEKFRLRGYGELQEDSPVFLEIKKKISGSGLQAAHAVSLDTGTRRSDIRGRDREKESNYE